MSAHNQLGKRGEAMAVAALRSKGYLILAKNWRYKRAEIDIIAKDPKENCLVFVEVKTRSTNYFGYPEESVTKQKIKLMAKAADAYLAHHPFEADMRFDVIAITINQQQSELIHIKDAFSLYDSF